MTTKKPAKRKTTPSKFTMDRRKRIIRALELGATDKIAADAAGVGYSTFRQWIFKGRKEGKGVHYNFTLEIQKAKAKGALACLEGIEEGIQKKDFKQAAWLLERRHKYHRNADPTDLVDIIDKIVSAKLETKKSTEPKDVIWNQMENLKRGMAQAMDSKSWQAYAALVRSYMQTYKEYMEMIQATKEMDDIDNLPDDELINEVTNIIVSLPPKVQDSILEKIGAIQNIIPIKKFQ